MKNFNEWMNENSLNNEVGNQLHDLQKVFLDVAEGAVWLQLKLKTSKDTQHSEREIDVHKSIENFNRIYNNILMRLNLS